MMRTSIPTLLGVAVLGTGLVTACIDAGPGIDSAGGAATQGSLADPEWERLPLQAIPELYPGNPKAWQGFARAVGAARPFTTCAGSWEAPPGIKVATTTLELRLRSSKDALRIEDIVILESNPADVVLERCVDASLRGREFPAPGMPPDQAFRYKFSAVKQLERDGE